MRTSRFVVVIVFAILSLSISAAADEVTYRTGALREAELPGWIQPSPRIQLEAGAGELDDACDNSAGLPPVGNQGGQGSCTAWATAYYYLTYTQGQEFGWDLTDPNHQMSPAFTYNMINGGADRGSHPSDAFLLFEQVGCGTYADMPYTDADHNRLPEEDTFRGGFPFRTLTTYSINTHTQAGLEDLKNHLLNGNIAATAITVWDNFNGINAYDTTYCVADIRGTDPGGHAVTVIGFDDDRVTNDGVGAFRMVNSWGTGWGNDGFWWMSYEAFLSNQIGWGYALYAEDRIAYEPRLAARIEPLHSDRYSLTYQVGVGTVNQQVMNLDFFDFYADSRSTEAFPWGRGIVVDVTDLLGAVDPDEMTPLYARVRDHDPDGQNGSLVALSLEDWQEQFWAVNHDLPVAIPDGGGTADAEWNLYYPARPPVSLEAGIDLGTGQTELSWPAVEEAAGFLGYVVYRDGVEIAVVEEIGHTDQLDEYGLYRYTLTTRWEGDVESWHGPEATVDYITPVPPSYAGVNSVQENGTYQYNWEQQRPVEIAYDDGENSDQVYFNQNAAEGASMGLEITAPGNGQLRRMGAYFVPHMDLPMGQVRYAVRRQDGQGQPGAVVFRSEPFVPEANEWRWLELDAERIALQEGEPFWLLVEWIDLMASPLGRDQVPNVLRSCMSPNGEQFMVVENQMIPMLRAEVGVEELVGGETGLVGFELLLDGETVAYVEDDSHQITGSLEQAGQYEFQLLAHYQQEVMSGPSETLQWDGGALTRGVDELPQEWSVGQAYPNPFNASTTLQVTLPQRSHLRVSVYDLLGREVARLVDGQRDAGNHRIAFQPHGVASGAYWISVEGAGGQQQVRRVMYIR